MTSSHSQSVCVNANCSGEMAHGTRLPPPPRYAHGQSFEILSFDDIYFHTIDTVYLLRCKREKLSVKIDCLQNNSAVFEI